MTVGRGGTLVFIGPFGKLKLFAVPLAAASMISCASSGSMRALSPTKDTIWMKKTITFRTRGVLVSYAVTLSSYTKRMLSCIIEVKNLGRSPIFFFGAKQISSERAEENNSELHFSVGDARLYSDFSIPRLDEIAPGGRLLATYHVDCAGNCSDLNFVYIDFDVIIQRGAYFHDLFQRLPRYGDRLGLNVGKDWNLFYSYLETQVVAFSLVPLKP